MSVTTEILAALVVGIILIDAFLKIEGGTRQTISATLLRLAKIYPIIPFALGVVAGHIFWPNC